MIFDNLLNRGRDRHSPDGMGGGRNQIERAKPRESLLQFLGYSGVVQLVARQPLDQEVWQPVIDSLAV